MDIKINVNFYCPVKIRQDVVVREFVYLGTQIDSQQSRYLPTECLYSHSSAWFG